MAARRGSASTDTPKGVNGRGPMAASLSLRAHFSRNDWNRAVYITKSKAHSKGQNPCHPPMPLTSLKATPLTELEHLAQTIHMSDRLQLGSVGIRDGIRVLNTLKHCYIPRSLRIVP
jgi:hypothetical protein